MTCDPLLNSCTLLGLNEDRKSRLILQPCSQIQVVVGQCLRLWGRPYCQIGFLSVFLSSFDGILWWGSLRWTVLWGDRGYRRNRPETYFVVQAQVVDLCGSKDVNSWFGWHQWACFIILHWNPLCNSIHACYFYSNHSWDLLDAKLVLHVQLFHLWRTFHLNQSLDMRQRRISDPSS